MKKISLIILAFAFMSFAFMGCEKDRNTGTLKLSITDAPLDSEGISGVFITITDIQYHIKGNNFESFPDFEGPKVFNLLELTHGVSELLGELEMEAGAYTQLRFLLDAPAFGMDAPANPGCYLEFEDGTTQPLFVPSGAQTGYKGIGTFTVPVNGTVEVTADFDVRKSVVEAGASGMFILKPTIRLVVDNQAGKIVGSVTHIPDGKGIVIYAYEGGTYSADEANEPPIETPRFPNAVSSDLVNENGNYHIDFLAPGSYDLVVAATLDGDFDQVLGIVEEVLVESNESTVVSIDVDTL